MSDENTATVQQPAPAPGVTEPVASSENASPAGAPAPQEETFFDAKDVPEQLKPVYDRMQKAYTQKTQSVSEERKLAQAMRQLASDQEFVKWYYGRQDENGKGDAPAPQVPDAAKPAGMSREQWADLQENPEKFAEWQNRQFEKYLADQKITDKLKAGEAELSQLKSEQQLQAFTASHPDFWDIDKITQGSPSDPGLIEIMTAAGLPLEKAYEMGSRVMSRIQKDAVNQAHAIVDDKKGATSEGRPAAPAPSPSNIRKVRGDLSDLVRAAAEEAAAGRDTTIVRE